MMNLLGDIWKGGEPDWSSILNDPRCKLHLYDKGEPRSGRKMGHFTVVGEDLEETLQRAESHFSALSSE